MRQETKTFEIYTFEELEPDIQAKVLARYWDITIAYDWWEYIYEDANQCNLDIKGFGIGIDNNSTCKLNFQTYPEDTAQEILTNHGEGCDTYKAAATFDSARIDAITSLENETGEPEDTELYQSALAEFKHALSSAYLNMLHSEYEWLSSEECVKDYIINNHYEFLVNGEDYTSL